MAGAEQTLEISAFSPDDLDAVYRELRGKEGISVTPTSAQTEPGYMGGVSDALIVGFTEGGAVALLEMVRTLVKSRGSRFKLKIRKGDTTIKITTGDADEALALLRELISGE
ncbi:hypothetical protein ABH926_005873 [Catenulispora sp. GP43]|uniref:effector-associated constant component EACC1 n=1 Tax=Catenulispora sp. GP43 TaxID=3156263 RepID=UPI003515178E